MSNLLSRLVTSKKALFCIALIIPTVFWIISPHIIPFSEFSPVERRMTALFILAAILWIAEPIPSFATSLLVIVLSLILVSDKGPIFFREGDVGTLIHYSEIMASFAAPIIILFLGGFTLAHAATKHKIDYTLARVILKPFGKSSGTVLLGIMTVTALFSMFMSNTATTTMMLSILIPVLRVVPPSDRIKSAFALGIPFAANIGGIATPIGTPPNAIALRALQPNLTITFSQWMLLAVPVVIIVLIVCWLLLKILFPTTTKRIDLSTQLEVKKEETQTSNNKSWRRVVTWITIALTIILWMTDFIHGMNSYVVAMIPMLVFFVTGVCAKEDLRSFNWDVLWLVSGGVAMGLGIEKTGLAEQVTGMIDFQNTSPILIAITAMIIIYVLSNFMSHTAASNLFIPIIVAVAYSLPNITQSGSVLIVLSTTFAASLSMLLPISTPPNALGYSTGLIRTKHMLGLGLIMGVLGTIVSYYYLATATRWLNL